MAGLTQLKGTMVLTILIALSFFAAFLAILLALLGINPLFSVLGALLFIIFQYAIGPSLVVASTHLRYLRSGESPWLESVVKDISTRSGIPMPRLAIVPDPDPNAFTFGHTSGNATLAVHQGLLEKLNQEEVKGVLGHEIGHIKHNDFIIMTMLSALPLIAYLIARGLFWSTDLRTSEKKEGRGVALFAAAIISYIAYIVSSVIVLRLSRLREHYADAFSAYITGTPRSLESALTKIAYGLSLKPGEPNGVRMFYISDPAQAVSEVRSILNKKYQYDLDRDGVLDDRELAIAMEHEARSNWRSINEAFMTHPPTFKRVLLLRQIEEEMRKGRYTFKDAYKYV